MPDRNAQSVARAGVQISLLIGDVATSWLDDEANLADWRSLYAKCPWGTSFQAADFFRVWFRHYGARWRPLLVLGFDDRGRLTALIPLAAGDGVVTGAGAHQAEYHGWLGAADGPSTFFKDAVAEILKTFPGHDLRLRCLPPGVPKVAVTALLDGDRRAIAVTHERPLLALDEAAINETLKKKSNRSKINRLKRLGAISIRKMEADEFERRIDEIGAMCDFRQGAVNDSCPFLNDAHKRPFHLDWVRTMPRDVHVSGMFVDDRLISVLIFALSKREAHIAITAHSPEHAEHSPGKIHIYEAALALAREGLSFVDMTPGGDEWKTRFATQTDKVVDLTVYANARKAGLARIRRTIGAKAGPVLSAIRRRFKGVATSKTASETVTYSLAARGTSADADPSAEVGVNALSDLLRFGPKVARRTRQEFLSQALARMEAGEGCYSLAGPRGLAGIGWRGTDALGDRLFDFSASPDSDARQVYAAILARMLAGPNGKGAAVRVAVPRADGDLRSVVERLGFQRDRPSIAER